MGRDYFYRTYVNKDKNKIISWIGVNINTTRGAGYEVLFTYNIKEDTYKINRCNFIHGKSVDSGDVEKYLQTKANRMNNKNLIDVKPTRIKKKLIVIKNNILRHLDDNFGKKLSENYNQREDIII